MSNHSCSGCSSSCSSGKGCCCRACNDFNEYAVPDQIVSDGKYTCWACAMHPDRKRRGLEGNREALEKLNKLYKK